MHTNLYILIAVGVVAGFFVRPLAMFLFSTIFSLEKYTRTKPQLIVLILTAVFCTMSLSFLSVFLLLKLSGFIPLQGNAPAFALSFFVGGALWVIYARIFNHTCLIDFND